MGVLLLNAALLQALIDVGERHSLPVIVPPRLKDSPWINEVDLRSNAFWLESLSESCTRS